MYKKAKKTPAADESPNWTNIGIPVAANDDIPAIVVIVVNRIGTPVLP